MVQLEAISKGIVEVSNGGQQRAKGEKPPAVGKANGPDLILLSFQMAPMTVT